MQIVRHVIITHWRVFSLVVVLAVFFWLIYELRSALFSFILGLIIAYIIMPPILWVERRLPHKDGWLQTKRVVLITIAYILFLAVVGAFFFLLFITVSHAFTNFLNRAPELTANALLTFGEWIEAFRRYIPSQMQSQIDNILTDLGTTMGDAVRNVFMTGVSLIPTTIGLVLGLAALPVFLFYLLKDWEKISRGFYSAFPGWAKEHARNIVSIVERILGRYIRATLLLGLIVGALDYIGLLILQVEFAPILALFGGVLEMVPTLGPWLAGATAVIVTLSLTPDKAIWVAVLFLAVQVFENTLICPKVQSVYLKIHPAIVIMLLVLGGYLAGFWGLLLMVPLTATLVELYKYVRHSMVIEDDYFHQDKIAGGPPSPLKSDETLKSRE